MLEAIRTFGQSGAILLLGLAVGAAWITTIVAPNTSYDELDNADADHHVRELLRASSDPIAVTLLVACALAILGGALAAGVSAGIAAFGFFTNRWTLGSGSPSTRKKQDGTAGKTQRVLAVSFTLVFSLVAAVSAVLAVLGY